MDCHITGCRSLETKCKNCGRVVKTADFKPPYEWVSIKDRMPETDTDVLVYINGKIKIDYRTEDYYPSDDDDDLISDYSWHKHGSMNNNDWWMSLPEPPKE